MKKVEVLFRGWGQDWLLGTLAQAGTELLFEYSTQALDRGIEYSKLLFPLRREAYGRMPSFPAHFSFLPGFVADALPDGWGLLLMDRLIRKAGQDPAAVSPLDRLSFIGDRAMGALAFRPSAELPLAEAELSLLEIAHAAREVEGDIDTAALLALAVVGGSPHGARPKALVALDGGVPWLVKFAARGEHREVCAIEDAYAAVARSCGVDMPPSRHFALDAHLSAFAVQRFDRSGELRIPVQSFAAALGADFRLPSLDYREVLRATRYFTNDEQAVRQAYARCVFNVVFNNRDDHAKNFALRMDKEGLRWTLAPAYDLSFSSGPRGQHQTSVMGEGAAPGREHLLALARDVQVPERIAVGAIDHVCAAADQLAAALDDGGVRKTTRATIDAAVRRNVQRAVTPAAVPRPRRR